MQSVDVLGDEPGRPAPQEEAREGAVGGVGLAGGEEAAAMIVPLPHRVGIARQCFRGGELLGAVGAPQAARVAKGGDAGLGGDARAGQRHDAARVTHQGAGFLQRSRAGHHAGATGRAGPPVVIGVVAVLPAPP